MIIRCLSIERGTSFQRMAISVKAKIPLTIKENLDMAKIDLKSMTRKELQKLDKDIDNALARIATQDLKAAKAAVEKTLKAQGFTLADIVGGKAPTKPAKAKVKKPAKPSAPKYANPSDPTQTWSGKGRRPEWFIKATDAGKSPEELAIKTS